MSTKDDFIFDEIQECGERYHPSFTIIKFVNNNTVLAHTAQTGFWFMKFSVDKDAIQKPEDVTNLMNSFASLGLLWNEVSDDFETKDGIRIFTSSGTLDMTALEHRMSNSAAINT